MNRKLSALILSFFTLVNLFAVSMTCAFAENISGLEKARESVVRIITCFTASDGYGKCSYGTGFFVDDTGKNIVTNYHVVDSSDAIRFLKSEGIPVVEVFFLVFYRDTFYVAKPEQTIRDPSGNDLAIIKLETAAKNVTPIVFADYNNVKVGDPVTAIGYPDIKANTNVFEQALEAILEEIGQSYHHRGEFGVAYSASSMGQALSSIEEQFVSNGIISQRAQDGDATVFLTDATISSGNSGGPLVNSSGQLVGINTWAISGEEVKSSSGVAISSKDVGDFIGYMGIKYTVASGAAGRSSDPTSSLPGSKSSALLILEVIGVLLCGAGLLFLIIKIWKKQPEEWECLVCHQKNSNDNTYCVGCGTKRGEDKEDKIEPPPPPPVQWECKKCGHKNPESTDVCTNPSCGWKRTDPVPPKPIVPIIHFPDKEEDSKEGALHPPDDNPTGEKPVTPKKEPAPVKPIITFSSGTASVSEEGKNADIVSTSSDFSTPEEFEEVPSEDTAHEGDTPTSGFHSAF